jgi:hypothetical protein
MKRVLLALLLALLPAEGNAGLKAVANPFGASKLGATLTNAGGKVNITRPVNQQTGTSYTVLSSDAGKLVTFDNASAVAVTLPQATTDGFTAGFSFTVQNIGAGIVTVTPATSTINGAASLSIAHNEGCDITSDGANYQVSACTAIPASVLPGPQSGRYYTSVIYSGLGTANQPGTGSNYIVTAIPFYLSTPATPTALACEVTTGSTTGSWKIDMGIYADNGGIPANLILDVGATSTGAITVAEAATGVQIQSIPSDDRVLLSPGVYWLAMISSLPSSGTPAFKAGQTNALLTRGAIGDVLTQGSASPSSAGYVLQNTNATSVTLPSAFGTPIYGSAGNNAPLVWAGF